MKEFFLFMNRKIIFILITLLLPVILPAQQFHGKHYVNRADTLLNTIIKFFDVPEYGLLSETYPKNLDICGENGEYHSFVFDGPIFKTPVDFKIVNKYNKTQKDLLTNDLHKYCYLELE